MQATRSRITTAVYLALGLAATAYLGLLAQHNAFASAGSAGTQQSDKEDVVRIEQAQWEAVKHKDKAAWGANLAEDYLDFGSDGRVDKAKSLSEGWMATRSDSTLTDFSWEDLQVKFLDANTALVTYLGKYREVTRGKGNTGSAYYSSLYQRRNGKWLTVFTQDSNLKCAGM